MQTITLEEAQNHLVELVEKLAPGAEVIITRDQKPVARLLGGPPPDAPLPVPGRGKGMLTVMAEDDEHLKDWAEYLP